MIFAALSDLHLRARAPECRLDDFVATELRKLEDVRTLLAMSAEPIALLLPGDIFDTPRSWEALAFFAPFFQRLAADKVPVFAVFGQHDTYYYNAETRAKTSLGVLAQAGLVKILGPEPVDCFGTKLYGAHFGDAIPSPEPGEGPNVLVVHAGISDAPIFPGHEYTGAMQFLKQHPGFDYVVCGDIHRRFIAEGYKGRIIMNSGPLFRASRDQRDHKPGFWRFDTNYAPVWMSVFFDKAEAVIREEQDVVVSGERPEFLQSFIDGLEDSDEVSLDFLTVVRELSQQANLSEGATLILADLIDRHADKKEAGGKQ